MKGLQPKGRREQLKFHRNVIDGKSIAYLIGSEGLPLLHYTGDGIVGCWYPGYQHPQKMNGPLYAIACINSTELVNKFTAEDDC